MVINMEERVSIGPMVFLISKGLGLWLEKVAGLENVPKNGPFIIAPNHSSYFDHAIIGFTLVPYLKRKLHIIAKKEHFENLSQKSWHNLWRKYASYIPIDRSRGGKALEKAKHALDNGAMLLIYPEGTRSLTGKIQKAKTGVARLALWSKAPVLPVGIMGAFEILPKGKKIPRLKKAALNFGKPMAFKKYHGKKMTKRLLREVTSQIMKEIARLSGQEYNF